MSESRNRSCTQGAPAISEPDTEDLKSWIWASCHNFEWDIWRSWSGGECILHGVVMWIICDHRHIVLEKFYKFLLPLYVFPFLSHFSLCFSYDNIFSSVYKITDFPPTLALSCLLMDPLKAFFILVMFYNFYFHLTLIFLIFLLKFSISSCLFMFSTTPLSCLGLL